MEISKLMSGIFYAKLGVRVHTIFLRVTSIVLFMSLSSAAYADLDRYLYSFENRDSEDRGVAQYISRYKNFHLIGLSEDGELKLEDKHLEYIKREIDRFLYFSNKAGSENLLLENRDINNTELAVVISGLDLEFGNAYFDNMLDSKTEMIWRETVVNLTLLDHLIESDDQLVLQHEFGHGVFEASKIDPFYTEAFADVFSMLVSDFSVKGIKRFDFEYQSYVCTTEQYERHLGGDYDLKTVLQWTEVLEHQPYFALGAYDLSCYVSSYLFNQVKNAKIDSVSVFENLYNALNEFNFFNIPYDATKIIRLALNQPLVNTREYSPKDSTKTIELGARSDKYGELKIYIKDRREQLGDIYAVEVKTSLNSRKVLKTSVQADRDSGERSLLGIYPYEEENLEDGGVDEENILCSDSDAYGRVLFYNSTSDQVEYSKWIRIEVTHLEECYTWSFIPEHTPF